MTKVWRVGDQYGQRDVFIKSITPTDGLHCPTKAYYDNGKTIPSSDKDIARAVLTNGEIHYLEKGTFAI